MTQQIFFWINTQIEWAKSFFNEPDGKGSSKRAGSFMVIAMFVYSYGKIAIEANQLLDIPTNWMITIAAVLGLGIMANTVKKGDSEQKS